MSGRSCSGASSVPSCSPCLSMEAVWAAMRRIAGHPSVGALFRMLPNIACFLWYRNAAFGILDAMLKRHVVLIAVTLSLYHGALPTLGACATFQQIGSQCSVLPALDVECAPLCAVHWLVLGWRRAPQTPHTLAHPLQAQQFSGHAVEYQCHRFESVHCHLLERLEGQASIARPGFDVAEGAAAFSRPQNPNVLRPHCTETRLY